MRFVNLDVVIGAFDTKCAKNVPSLKKPFRGLYILTLKLILIEMRVDVP